MRLLASLEFEKKSEFQSTTFRRHDCRFQLKIDYCNIASEGILMILLRTFLLTFYLFFKHFHIVEIRRRSRDAWVLQKLLTPIPSLK